MSKAEEKKSTTKKCCCCADSAKKVCNDIHKLGDNLISMVKTAKTKYEKADNKTKKAVIAGIAGAAALIAGAIAHKRNKIMSYVLDACPNCKKETMYHPNPFYLHICEHCKYECTLKDLITAVDKDKIEKEIQKLKRLLENYPHIQNGKLIEKFSITEISLTDKIT